MVAEAPVGPDSVRAAVDRGAAAARTWAARPEPVRAALLEELTAQLRVSARAAALLRADEFGVPVRYSERWHGRNHDRRPSTAKPGALSVVVLGHNSVHAGSGRPLLPALAAGGACLLAVGPETVRSAQLVVEAAVAAGLPDGLVQVLCATPEATAALATDRRVDRLCVTGHDRLTACAAVVRRRAGLSLYGAPGVPATAVVLGTAAPERVAAEVAAVCLMGNGQFDSACSRLLVPRALWSATVDAVTDAVSHLIVGDPRDAGTEIGPMTDDDRLDELTCHLGTAWRTGARITTGGARHPDFDEGAYFEPTVLLAPEALPPLAHLRGPGPVVTLIPYDGGSAGAVELVLRAGWSVGAMWTGLPLAAPPPARAASAGTRTPNVA